jgi:hypothetical protein
MPFAVFNLERAWKDGKFYLKGVCVVVDMVEHNVVLNGMVATSWRTAIPVLRGGTPRLILNYSL